ncbi:MAG TPA: hypothetical protein VFV40_09405, partial [Nocardioides sp.]|nr:hypothetical protein [Nocardioides sp.]
SALLGSRTDASEVDELRRAGVVVDERTVVPLLAEERDGGPTRAAAAALALSAGTVAPEAAARRAGCTVEVVRFGHPAATSLVASAERLLATSGVRTSGGTTGRRTGRGRGPRLGLLVGAGEPDRELADRWLRDAVPFVVARLREGRAVLGPFVAPGRTACLRCVDAHHTDCDPDWPLLVRQLADACVRDRVDGVPEPVDPSLGEVAVAWACRDLLTYLDGGRPTTWSATLSLDADLGGLERRAWPRHAECACTWA